MIGMCGTALRNSRWLQQIKAAKVNIFQTMEYFLRLAVTLLIESNFVTEVVLPYAARCTLSHLLHSGMIRDRLNNMTLRSRLSSEAVLV